MKEKRDPENNIRQLSISPKVLDDFSGQELKNDLQLYQKIKNFKVAAQK